MKNKSADETVRAFILITKKRCCINLNSDSGTEFCSKKFRDLCLNKNINFFQNVDDATHACVVERVIQTFKRKLYKYFFAKNTLRYIDVYKKICDAYNKSYHRTIKMAPIQVNESNIKEVYYNIKQSQHQDKIVKSHKKLREGDFVRISKKKTVHFKASKGMNFSDEIFKILQVIEHEPVMYKLVDMCGEVIKGKFYSSELQRVIFDPEKVFVDKILKTRKNNGIIQCLVTRSGWPSTYSIWINKNEINQKS
jgi:hypothetical protein